MGGSQQGMAFHGEIEHIGSYVSARYSIGHGGGAYGLVYSDTRIFSSRITARAWLEQEAERRGIKQYVLNDSGLPAKR